MGRLRNNVGELDRIIRTALGFSIAWIGAAYGCWLGLIAVVPLVAAISGHCSIYMLLGISSVRPREEGLRLDTGGRTISDYSEFRRLFYEAKRRQKQSYA